jgi:hypothetical protein
LFRFCGSKRTANLLTIHPQCNSIICRLSCSCFYYQYFKCYSPVSFAKKWDKSGAYIRHWLPQLANMPDKYSAYCVGSSCSSRCHALLSFALLQLSVCAHLVISTNQPATTVYEPWTAPAAVQQTAGCIVGQDYPSPIVDHGVALPANKAKMAAAYAAHKQRMAGGGGGGGAAKSKKAKAAPAAKAKASKKVKTEVKTEVKKEAAGAKRKRSSDGDDSDYEESEDSTETFATMQRRTTRSKKR